MTLIFAISGIAVNHINDWNPNYQVVVTAHELPGISDHVTNSNLNQLITAKLAISHPIRAEFWQSPTKYKLFFENDTNVVIDFHTELAYLEQIKPRVLIQAFNKLRLNELRKSWTYFSDLFAGLLIFLAISSLFMVKGNKGVTGKRGLLVISGFIIPLVFILI